MELLSLLSLKVVFFILIFQVGAAVFPSEIAIGGIFDEDDGGSYSASKLAFNIAVQDINVDGSILSGVTLKGIVNTTSSLSVKESVANLCDQLSRNIVALIGPCRSTVVKAINYICSGLGLPQVSYAASDPALFTSHQQYPYLIRTSLSGDGYSMAIMELMKYFKWDKAAMLVSSDDYGNSFEHIQQFSIEKEISIVKTETFPALENVSLIDFASPLNSILSSSVPVVILNCPGKYAERLFDAATSLGMMSAGWVWIVSDAIATEINLYNASVGPPSHLQGILGVVPSSAQVKNKASFETKWKANGGKLPINAYSYKVYDAVWIVAHALNKMKVNGDNLIPPSLSCTQCDQNTVRKWSDGLTLLNKMKEVQFTGEFHPIQFDDDGTMIDEEFDFVNLQQTGFRRVGYWKNSTGLQVNTSEIIWLGATTSKPRTSSFLLKNKTLRIVTVVEPPFTMRNVGNYTGNDVWKGYCIDILKLLARDLEFNYIIHESYDGNFGGKDEDTQEWNGMVKELQTGQADLAFAAFTISSLRQEVIDFTIPYIDLGLTVIMKKKTREKGLLAFMDPYTNDVWFLLLCSTMYVGIVLSMCSALSPYGYYGENAQVDQKLLDDEETEELEEDKNNMRLDEAAWFSMGSLLGQGTDHQPRAISGKVVAAMWWMTGTIFVATYTANLAAFLTISKSAINIRSIEDLANQDEIKYGTVKSSQPSEFFERSNVALYQKMWAKMNTEETLLDTSAGALKKVQDGEFAFIWDSAVLEYVINQDPCNTFVLHELISPLGYGIGLPLNSPYKDVFSTQILKLRENGFLDKLKSEWFVQKGKCQVASTTKKLLTVVVSDVLGVYYLVVGGVVLAFIALVFEWLYFTRKLVKKEKYPTFKEAFKARLSIVWKDMKSRWISRRPVAAPTQDKRP